MPGVTALPRASLKHREVSLHLVHSLQEQCANFYTPHTLHKLERDELFHKLHRKLSACAQEKIREKISQSGRLFYDFFDPNNTPLPDRCTSGDKLVLNERLFQSLGEELLLNIMQSKSVMLLNLFSGEREGDEALLGSRNTGYDQSVVSCDNEPAEDESTYKFLPSFWGLLPRILDVLTSSGVVAEIFTVMKEWCHVHNVQTLYNICQDKSALPSTFRGATIMLLRTSVDSANSSCSRSQKTQTQTFVYHLFLGVECFETPDTCSLKELLGALNCPRSRLENESLGSLIAELCLYGEIPRILVQEAGLVPSKLRKVCHNFISRRCTTPRRSVKNLCYRLTYDSHLRKQEKLVFEVESRALTVAVSRIAGRRISRRSRDDGSKILRSMIKQISKSLVSVFVQAGTERTFEKLKYKSLYEAHEEAQQVLEAKTSECVRISNRLQVVESEHHTLEEDKAKLQEELSREADLLRKELHELRNTQASLEVANLQLMAMREQFQLQAIASNKDEFDTLADEYEQLLNWILEAEATQVAAPQDSNYARLAKLKGDLYKFWRRAVELSHAQAFSNFKKTESELKQELQNLHNRIKGDARAAELARDNQQAKVERLKEQVSCLLDEKKSLNQQIKETIREKDVQQQTHEIKLLRLESENTELHEHLHQLQSLHSESQSQPTKLQDSPSVSVRTKASYQRKVAELQTEIMELKSKLEAKNEEKGELSLFQRRLSDVTGRNEVLEHKLSICIKEMTKINEEVEVWRSKSAKADEIADKYKHDVIKLREEINGISSSPDTLSTREVGALVISQRELQIFFKQWRSKLAELSDSSGLQTIDLATQLNKLEQVYQSEILKQQKAAAILRESNQVQDSELKRMHVLIGSLNKKTEVARLEKKAWESTRKSLERQIKSLRIENQKLKLTY